MDLVAGYYRGERLTAVITFEVIPAVDVMNGRGVRLWQGAFDQATDYGDPLDLARRWVKQGAFWLHLVDLDGARTGQATALTLAAEIRLQTGCRVQYGGGLRGAEQIAAALEAVDRVIVSSWALRNPGAFGEVAKRFPGRILVSLDVRDNRVWVDGWQTPMAGSAAGWAKRFLAAGAQGVVVTQIDRDGTLAGVDPGAVEEVTGWQVPFWWAGGIGTAADIDTVARHGGAYARGVIVGKALYSGRVDLPDVLRRVAAAERDGEGRNSEC